MRAIVVLNDEDTYTDIGGCEVVQFNEEEANDLIDEGGDGDNERGDIYQLIKDRELGGRRLSIAGLVRLWEHCNAHYDDVSDRLARACVIDSSL